MPRSLPHRVLNAIAGKTLRRGAPPGALPSESSPANTDASSGEHHTPRRDAGPRPAPPLRSYSAGVCRDTDHNSTTQGPITLETTASHSRGSQALPNTTPPLPPIPPPRLSHHVPITTSSSSSTTNTSQSTTHRRAATKPRPSTRRRLLLGWRSVPQKQQQEKQDNDDVQQLVEQPQSTVVSPESCAGSRFSSRFSRESVAADSAYVSGLHSRTSTVVRDPCDTRLRRTTIALTPHNTQNERSDAITRRPSMGRAASAAPFAAAHMYVSSKALEGDVNATYLHPIASFCDDDMQPKIVGMYKALPLNTAVLRGDREGVRRLLEAGALPLNRDSRGRNAIVVAIYGDDVIEVTANNDKVLQCRPEHQSILRMLLLHIHLDSINRPEHGIRGITPLCLASYLGKVELVDILLDAGADPNATDVNCATALMYAARDGHSKVVSSLLKMNADPGIKDIHGWDAISFATNYPRLQRKISIVQSTKEHSIASKSPSSISPSTRILSESNFIAPQRHYSSMKSPSSAEMVHSPSYSSIAYSATYNVPSASNNGGGISDDESHFVNDQNTYATFHPPRAEQYYYAENSAEWCDSSAAYRRGSLGSVSLKFGDLYTSGRSDIHEFGTQQRSVDDSTFADTTIDFDDLDEESDNMESIDFESIVNLPQRLLPSEMEGRSDSCPTALLQSQTKPNFQQQQQKQQPQQQLPLRNASVLPERLFVDTTLVHASSLPPKRTPKSHLRRAMEPT